MSDRLKAGRAAVRSRPWPHICRSRFPSWQTLTSLSGISVSLHRSSEARVRRHIILITAAALAVSSAAAIQAAHAKPTGGDAVDVYTVRAPAAAAAGFA